MMPPETSVMLALPEIGLLRQLGSSTALEMVEARTPRTAPRGSDEEIDEVEAERARLAAEEDDEDDFESAMSLAAKSRQRAGSA